ncbi:MAG: DNA cytosine methyltransferase [Solirubrobacterales bacterium]
MAPQPHSFVSLYAGAGGLDCGFVEAGFKPLWANDFDRDAVATYNDSIGKHAVCGDINEVRGQLAGLRPDLVIGGPPCQGFSVAGHLRPDDPRSRHVWTFLEVVEELRPRAFVMENVKNLAVNPRWQGLIDGLRERAEANGYKTRVSVLNASHYGVPQARERMFMVGIRDAEPQKPPATTEGQPPTVREALSGHPPLGKPGNDSLCTALVTPARNPVMRPSPYAGLLFNGKGRALNLDAPAPTLPATMGGNRTPIIDQRQLEGLAEENWVVGYHRRLSAGRGPVAKVPKRMRRLTVEEAQVLQTFPERWSFSGRQSSRFRQIGNAVPPLLAQAVAEQLALDLATGEAEAGAQPASEPALLAA